MKYVIAQTLVLLTVAAGTLVFAQPPAAMAPPDASGQANAYSESQQNRAATATPFLDLRRPEVPQQTASTPPSVGNSDLFVGLGVWTVIVLCLCVLTVLGIRHWQRGRGMLPLSNSSSRVLETVSLGPNRMISLVALGDVRAIVGCDAAGIRSIVLAPPRFEEELSMTEHQSDT